MDNLRAGTIRPLQVVLISLVIVAVAGGSWLLSATESLILVDGAIDWKQESPLRAVVQLLCVNYEFPTIHAGEIKMYFLGMASGLALIALTVAATVRSYATNERGDREDWFERDDGVRPGHRVHLGPLRAAQLLVVLYLLWSLAGYRVSAAPELAVGGSVLLAIHFAWAFALGRGLNASSARLAARMIVGISTVTALLALWYYYGRNPTLRAKFPFGNPNFLAACLIPGILLAISLLGNALSQVIRFGKARSMIVVVLALAVIAAALWAFYKADSRGPALGLAAALAALAFFMLRRRAKIIPVAACVTLLIIAGAYYGMTRDEASPTGRSATIRFRIYSWSYALRMFADKPLTGHGQGGFVLAGDSYAMNDVLDDPLALDARIAHAHNEWLEIMADLGCVGILLILTALVLTLRAGTLALQSLPSTEMRWTLAGLMAALVGLIVEESFGVGLRVSGVPSLFYTVLGLIWAMSRERPLPTFRRLPAAPFRRFAIGAVGGLTGFACLVITQQDFHAARAAFQAQESARSGDYATAIQWASAARSRLNPQRALANLYRLAEAHMLAAQGSRDRAADRERRARISEVPDQRLLELAAADRALSDRHCSEGSTVLKELVAKAPGLMNHGSLLYGLNIVQADNAAARGEPDKETQYLRDAATALERELLRQPFHPSIAIAYLRVARGKLDGKLAGTVLARPLRHNRVTVDFVDFLAEGGDDPVLLQQLDDAVKRAKSTLAGEDGAETMAEITQTWVPELLRLSATVRFRSGDYESATEVLEMAAQFYEVLSGAAPIGAASCYAELAHCRFLNRPDQPDRALAGAARAVSLAPESLAGRSLKAAARQQMIEYFLAADNEEDAKRLMQEEAGSMSEETSLTELGVRYRVMCEGLLHRRLAVMLRQSPNDLMAKLERWTRRAIELSPDDHAAHYLAADLAFHDGSCEAAAGHLRDALATGLPPKAATDFLRMALGKGPECDALKRLAEDLAQSVSSRRETHTQDAPSGPEPNNP